jgi:hypothetical protein|nr:MAG TPA: Lysozyme [Caudoviricetes sp.]
MHTLAPQENVFDRAFNNSLGLEGGFVNDPDDAGGATKYGVSLRTYRLYFPEADISTIQSLTVDDAKAFYKKYFWQANRYDRIKNSDIAIKVFDACINTGPHQAHLCLQRALNCVGFKLAVDGALGPATLEALNRTESPEWNFAILCAYRSELAGYYRLLVERKPENKKFLDGWIVRAYK